MELDGHDVSVQRINGQENDIMQSQNRQMIYGFPCFELNVHVYIMHVMYLNLFYIYITKVDTMILTYSYGIIWSHCRSNAS